MSSSLTIKGLLGKLIRGDVATNATVVSTEREAPTAEPYVDAVRIKRVDANNLLRRLEQELSRLIEDKDLLAEQYADSKLQDDEIRTEIIARSFMGIEQTICLKKNLHGELAELEQMLHWDENRSAFDFISRSFSIDIDQSKEVFEGRIAKHAVLRRKQFDLAQIVKEGEVALGKMRDDDLEQTKQNLDRLLEKRARNGKASSHTADTARNETTFTGPVTQTSSAAEDPAPFCFVQARDISADLKVLPFICYALQHVGINPVRSLRIVNSGHEASQNLVVEVALVPEDFGMAWTCNIPELAAGASWESTNISLPLRLDRLRQVQEKEKSHIRITVRDKDEVLLARTQEMPVLAYNEWLYLPEFLEFSATFVQPNSPSLSQVLEKAATRLDALCGSRAFSGYQRCSQAHVRQMLTAIHNTLSTDYPIDYINPPPSFETTGQKVRLVADTLLQQRGTCLDLAILQAALWEHIGLHPCLVLVPGHALLACWQEERHGAQPVVQLDGSGKAAKAMRLALTNGTLLLVNSVEITARQNFEEAAMRGRQIVDKVLNDGHKVQIIDLVASRANVTPLP